MGGAAGIRGRPGRIALAGRRWWSEQLAARGLKLLALYPRLPAAIAALDGPANATLIEVEPHAVARSVLRQGALVSLEILPTSEVEPAASVCRELLDGTDPEQTFVCGSLADRAWVAALGRPAALLEPPIRVADDGNPAAWAGLAGTARHASGRGGPLAPVPARDAAPPLLRRTGVRWAAAILIVAASAFGMDRLAARSLSRAVDRLGEAQKRLEKVTREIREVERRGATANTIGEEIEALERERDTLRARLDLLDEGVAARSRLLPELLDALAGAANDEILLDRTAEVSPGHVSVEGRALSERAVQAFAQSVAARVLTLRLRVVDQAIRRGSARLTGGFYLFSFQLEPLDEENP